MTMGITYQEILEADTEMASRFDKPKRFGLQTLTAEEQNVLFDYIDESLEPTERVSFYSTSEYIAREATRHFRKLGMKTRITNLMVKSAMLLLGFEPSVPNVDILHYRAMPRKRGLSD